MRAKCHLAADAHCRLERALHRAWRTLPMLRLHGECLLCSRPAHDAHTDTCPVLLVLAELERHVGKIAPRVYPSAAALRMRRIRAMRKQLRKTA